MSNSYFANKLIAFELLLEKGVPEEWAFLIAENIKFKINTKLCACEVVTDGMIWRDTKEGNDFWLGVAQGIKSELGE